MGWIFAQFKKYLCKSFGWFSFIIIILVQIVIDILFRICLLLEYFNFILMLEFFNGNPDSGV